MKGKNFIISLFIFFFIFTFSLFLHLYYDGWFDTFLNGGFNALYGD